MKVALFGGSFNPPHIGHQLVAAYVLETEDVDAIWFIPTYKHALGKELVAFAHRFEMVRRLADLFDQERVHVSTVEYNLSTRSGYVDSKTIHLVRYLKELYPEISFRTVIGSDLIEQSKTWDNWDEIEKIAPPIVVGRIGYGDSHVLALPNISSTEVRTLIKGGVIDKVVPKSVIRYIEKHGLYK